MTSASEASARTALVAFERHKPPRRLSGAERKRGIIRHNNSWACRLNEASVSEPSEKALSHFEQKFSITSPILGVLEHNSDKSLV
jgi:hypothetical protein